MVKGFFSTDMTPRGLCIADSSPQFSQDYLIIECDFVDLEDVYPLNPETVLQQLTFNTRVLPFQVLGRKATSTAYKFRAVMRSLRLETGNTALARSRPVSFLDDMGVESELAAVPDMDGKENHETIYIYTQL